MSPDASRSIPGVLDARLVRGAQAPEGGPPDVLLEVPHGATRAAHFEAVKARMVGAFPPDLADFFFVNTDVGAPEVADRLAALIVAADPRQRVLVLRALLPRTFIDCNRVIDADTRPAASQAGAFTPGISSYVTDPRDLRSLYELYRAYRETIEQAYAEVCGAGGTAVMVHSYAPRSLDIPVDDRIVERLREEYRPERLVRWPLRVEVDLITTTPEGVRLASAPFVESARAAFLAADFACGTDATYQLHPSTMGCLLAARYPGQTLCLEVRRDLLVAAFTPFQEMTVLPERVDRVAQALCTAYRALPLRPQIA